ncbi:MAG: hypothetical protein ACN6QT_29095 [Burkholderia contaminans]|uniref:Molecular chaperone n=1 Tax=Burkholderia contaminans TaxID=488447 RepID=A0AAP4VHB0_9BURK|nr:MULTISPECIES: hypothetical protein [Burkholderia]MBD1414004.1 hypothetical protein [Burkholderia contaminans]MBH9665691.1 hypothetical protein [Burkholderia contaminans]MBH9674759.1 hypothetical protein [Burkholderia contaminans]MBH9704805.1 hypothetical protein [Burkholderia contaminans]MBH9722918.1 hypothetical protein [Burkholderia contaminans]
MNIVINDTAWMDAAPGMAEFRPVEHKSSQISTGPHYVTDVPGRFGADSTDASDAAPVVLGYN